MSNNSELQLNLSLDASGLSGIQVATSDSSRIALALGNPALLRFVSDDRATVKIRVRIMDADEELEPCACRLSLHTGGRTVAKHTGRELVKDRVSVGLSIQRYELIISPKVGAKNSFFFDIGTIGPGWITRGAVSGTTIDLDIKPPGGSPPPCNQPGLTLGAM